LYWYCTDFCVNVANLLGVTYYDFNFWLFIIVFPGTLIALTAVNVARLYRIASGRGFPSRTRSG